MSRMRNVGRMLCGLVVLSGCQTDRVVGRRHVPGPVTSFESVEIARQSNMSLAEKSEVDLVEQLLYHRTLYAQTLEQLRNFYQQKGYAEKRTWTETEMSDLRRVRPYHYLLDSELPRLDLVPERAIPEADVLYDQALAKAKEAGLGLPGLYNRAKMSDALNMFKQLIREYPKSDKIDDAAFYCGELYKEYFDSEESIAVKWYELAWTWDPATSHPARFQAAVVYDYRLHDRERALELYRAAVAAESNRSNKRWAVERIKQLTEIGPVESRRTAPIVSPDQTIGHAEPASSQPRLSGGGQ